MYLTLKQLERINKNYNKIMDNVHVVRIDETTEKQEGEKDGIHN